MVVVLVIAVLIAVGIPQFLGARVRAQDRAQDRAAQEMLLNGAKAEAAWAADDAGSTDDVTLLRDEEPSLHWRGASDEAIHVVTTPDGAEVLLYARSSSGTWFVVRLAGGRSYTCLGAAAAEVDDMTDCTAIEW